MPRGFADLQFVCAIVFQLRFCSYCFVVVVIAVWQLLQLHFIVVIVAAACRVQSTNVKRVQPLYRNCFVIYRTTTTMTTVATTNWLLYGSAPCGRDECKKQQ